MYWPSNANHEWLIFVHQILPLIVGEFLQPPVLKVMCCDVSRDAGFASKKAHTLTCLIWNEQFLWMPTLDSGCQYHATFQFGTNVTRRGATSWCAVMRNSTRAIGTSQ